MWRGKQQKCKRFGSIFSELRESGSVEALSRVVESHNSLRSFQSLLAPSLTGLQNSMNALQGLYEVPYIQELLGDQAARLSNRQILPLIQSFSNLSELPFDNGLIATAMQMASYANASEDIDGDEYPEEFQAVEQELESSSEVTSFNSLSLYARFVFIYLMLEFVIPFLINISAAHFYDNYISRMESYGQVTSSRKVRKLTKCESNLERESLSQCRVVSRNGIALRDGPSQKANTIANVSIATLIAVIDDSDRTWLHVEVLSEDVHIEGWMLRRYTEKFR